MLIWVALLSRRFRLLALHFHLFQGLISGPSSLGVGCNPPSPWGFPLLPCFPMMWNPWMSDVVHGRSDGVGVGCVGTPCLGWLVNRTFLGMGVCPVPLGHANVGRVLHLPILSCNSSSIALPLDASVCVFSHLCVHMLPPPLSPSPVVPI